MFFSYFKSFSFLMASLYVFIIFISIIFIPIFAYNYNISIDVLYDRYFFNIDSDFAWPVPAYNTISSYYGKRVSPTQGASSFHRGIDIAAPTGANLVAVSDAQVTYTGFNGSGGFTIILSKDNYTFYYSHVSPNFIVKVNDFVYKGDVIGYVGPKNVYNIPNNPYYDSQGNPTNGATTGPHLHFAIKIDGQTVNPLDFY